MNKRFSGTFLHLCESCHAEVLDIDWEFHDIKGVEWCEICVDSYYLAKWRQLK